MKTPTNAAKIIIKLTSPCAAYIITILMKIMKVINLTITKATTMANRTTLVLSPTDAIKRTGFE